MKTILVVEDNQINRDLIRAVVERAYPEVSLIEAQGGDQAVQLFQQKRPELVLMDLRMPGKDGFEAAADMRKIEAEGVQVGVQAGTEHDVTMTAPSACIMALTAGNPSVEEQRCRRAGMNGVLTKPITPQGLRSVIGSNL